MTEVIKRQEESIEKESDLIIIKSIRKQIDDILKKDVDNDLIEILSSASNKELINLISVLLKDSRWNEWESATPWSKWKLMIHSVYWKFSSWNVDQNKDYILDENWIPENFTFVLKWKWTFIRLNWDIRYTKPFRKI